MIITVVFSTAVMLLLLLFIPVKFAVKIENIPVNNGDFFILEQQSVTAPNWRVIGNHDGTFPADQYFSVLIEGIDPQIRLNNSLQIDSLNKYIVYGEIVSESEFLGETYPLIYSTGFDILYPIERGNSLRSFVSRNYLTILDYTWFS